MHSAGARWRQHRAGQTSRRWFLAGAALAVVPGVAPGQTRASQSRLASGRYLAYAGTYSSPQGPEGSPGRGQGIYQFEMDPATGALTQRALVPNGANPSCLALGASRRHLYAANETAVFEGAQSGSVSAYSIDESSGRLTLLNTVGSEGAGPAHLSVHPSGRHVLVANYAGGTVAVLPVQPNGGLGAATDVQRDQGALGSSHAASAPPGSFAISGHDRPHAHMVQSDPSGRFVLSSDLGLDRILIWKFDAATGKLSPNDPPYVPLPAGDGPRHFAFHPNGRWMYSLQEEASTLVLFDYDAGSGSLKTRQTVSTLPKGFAGTDFTSEILIAPGGRTIYAANRLHDSIAWFSIDPNGALTPGGEEWTRGDYPRSFTIDPTGNFLYSCNQRSDAITTFRVNRKTGGLSFTGQYTAVGTPSILVFVDRVTD
jgi:6-phosphogluconolactonase (cycloisomerase 2 family)